MKYLYNNTQSDIFINKLGFNLKAQTNTEIPPLEYSQWAYCEQVLELINSEDITVNDGTIYYTIIADAIAFLRE